MAVKVEDKAAGKIADKDYKALIEDKRTELKNSGLWGRMDADRELAEGKKFTLYDVDNKEVPNAISMTLNDPGVFATNVESNLNNATEQVIVESDDKNLDTAYIEDLVKAAFATASRRLVSAGKFPLNPFIDQQMTRRGRGYAVVLFRMSKKGKERTLICDITPWDSRFVFGRLGQDGFDWAAYETYRTKGSLRVEYPKADIPAGEDSEDIKVWNCFDKHENSIWADEQKVFYQPHHYGRVPVCGQIVPMGSMMADKESRAAQGESIFFLIRDLIPELNRLASIMQSLNQKELDHALLWLTKEGLGAKPPRHRDLTKPGKVVSADIGGGVQPVNFGDLKRHAWLLHSMIETRIQRGSLSNLDLGIMGNQPWSAVSLIEIGEGRDQVFLPRLGARGLLNQQIANMIIEQIQMTGATSVEIGTKGHKRTFDVSKLKGEYEIFFKYFVKSPKVDAARFAMATAAEGRIPDRAILRDILQREDPEEDERWLAWEEAAMLSPAIKMNRTIIKLLEMAKRGDKHAEFEAEVLAAQMGKTIEQVLAGEVEPIQPRETRKSKQLLPMFGSQGGAGGSAQKAAQLQAEPRAEEGE